MTKYFRNFGRRQPVTPADTTPPSDPASLAATTVAAPVLTWTASTDNVAVAGYQVHRQTGAGSFARIDAGDGAVTTPTYIDSSAVPNTSYGYKVKAYDPSGNLSGFSNAATVTTPSGSTADVTAPAVPAQPTLVSGGGGTLATRVSWPPVSDTVVGGAVTSGMGVQAYDVEIEPDTGLGFSHVAYVDQPTTIAAEVARDIGGSSPSGTDNGSTITGPTNGNHYGTSDTFFFKSAPVIGDCTAVIDALTGTGSYWQKPLILEMRGGVAAAASYINIFHFATDGANTLMCEWRDGGGAASQQIAAVAVSLPLSYRIRRVTGTTFVVEYAASQAALISSPILLKSLLMTNMPAQIEVGRGSDGGTATYANYALTGASPVVFDFTGVAGKTESVRIKARDIAGNVAAASAARAIAYDAANMSGIPTPAIASAGYLIGGSPRAYDADAFITFAAQGPTAVLAKYEGWDGGSDRTKNMAQVCTAIKAINANIVLGIYIDAMFMVPGTSSLVSRALTYNWLLRSSYPSGSYVTSGGSYVGNMVVGGPTDPQGRSFNQCVIDFVKDHSRDGGAAGLASGTNVANQTGFAAIYFDDVFCNDPVGGDWLRGVGGDVNAAIRAGWLDMFARTRAAGYLVACNVSQMMDAAHNATDYVGQIDVGLLENMLGTVYSYEQPNYGNTFATSLAAYQKAMTMIKPGGRGIFCHSQLRADGSDPLIIDTSGNITSWSPAHQGLRHGFAYCIVCENAEYFYTATHPLTYNAAGAPYDCNVLNWHDTLSINPTTHVCNTYPTTSSGNNFLGARVGAVPTAAWQNGVWRAEFANAWVYLNPRGNGSQTVNLGGTFYLPNSAQDSSYTGAAITSRVMADRDGFVVFKT